MSRAARTRVWINVPSFSKKFGTENIHPANTDMRPNPRQIRQAFLPVAALAVIVSLLPPACSGEGTDLTGSQAWVLEPSAEGVSTGGLTVRNRTNEARTLRHIMATDFRRARILEATGARADSSPPPPIVVEANQSAELPPVGVVFLLEGPERPLHAGDETLLAFHFDDSQTIFINAEVRATSPSLPSLN